MGNFRRLTGTAVARATRRAPSHKGVSIHVLQAGRIVCGALVLPRNGNVSVADVRFSNCPDCIQLAKPLPAPRVLTAEDVAV